MHWAFDYIGEPWIRHEHDCWQFFRRVQADRFGRIVPAIPMETYRRGACQALLAEHEERAHWQPVTVPQEGDAVLLAHARHPTHIGLWVDADGGGVLHCVGGIGVCFQTVKSLKSGGWGHLEFYRHV